MLSKKEEKGCVSRVDIAMEETNCETQRFGIRRELELLGRRKESEPTAPIILFWAGGDKQALTAFWLHGALLSNAVPRCWNGGLAACF